MEAVGWVQTVRQQKKYSFLELSDGSCVQNLQVMWASQDPVAAAGTDMKNVTTGCSVAVKGVLVPSPKPGQPMELQLKQLELMGTSPVESYPLQKKVRGGRERLAWKR